MNEFLARLAQHPQLKAEAVEYLSAHKQRALESLALAQDEPTMFRLQGRVQAYTNMIAELDARTN